MELVPTVDQDTDTPDPCAGPDCPGCRECDLADDSQPVPDADEAPVEGDAIDLIEQHEANVRRMAGEVKGRLRTLRAERDAINDEIRELVAADKRFASMVRIIEAAKPPGE